MEKKEAVLRTRKERGRSLEIHRGYPPSHGAGFRHLPDYTGIKACYTMLDGRGSSLCSDPRLSVSMGINRWRFPRLFDHTASLADCYGIIGIEDLNIKGLLKNRCLARSFSDAALGTLLSLLTSKVEQRGGHVVKVGRFFPSSKTCHGCGWRWEDMDLSDRVFLCQNANCGYYHFTQDRDHNAGHNILDEALRLIGLIDQAVYDTGSDET